MKNNILLSFFLFISICSYSNNDTAAIAQELLPVFKKFSATELVKGGRIDAIRPLGGSTVLCATRGLGRGMLFISYDYGANWQLLAKPTTSEITCIAGTGNTKEFYILTGNAEVLGTADGGKTWQLLTKLLAANKNKEKYTASYAIMYTSNGTLLVTDTDSDGGHIYRSANKGKSWADMGAVAKNALYRLEKVGNGIIVNGWDGAIYKSIDDGITWNKMQQLTNAALFATEYMGVSKVLQADQSGNIFVSNNLGYVWEKTGNLTDAADDFINIGYGAVYYGTYTGKKDLYLSVDYGRTWRTLGNVPTGAEGDWLDHGISVETKDSIIILAGTNKGFIIRNAIAKNWLYQSVNDLNGRSVAIESDKVKKLDESVIGSIVDINELDEPEDILTGNGFAYIPCRDGNNVAVFDYTNPSKPVLASSIRDIDILDAFSVAIKNNCLYVLSMTNCKLSVFDIKNPYAPRKITSITVGGQGSYLNTYKSDYTRLRKIYIDGNYAYVTHSSESKVYIIDITTPVKPFIVSSFHTGDGAFAALAKGNVLYLAGYGPGSSVIAVDVSNKARPVIKSRILDTILLKGTCALALKENKLYVTAYNANTFWVMDVSDPYQLKVDSYISDAGMKGPGRVVIKDNTAFVLNSSNDSMAAIDITDSKKPAVKFYLQDPLLKRVYGIAIDADKLLLAGREAKSLVLISLNKLMRK